MKSIEFLKKYQQTIVLALACLLVGLTGFYFGNGLRSLPRPTQIEVTEAFSYVNDNQNLPPTQLSPGSTAQGQSEECTGLIKGNIGNAGTKIYHLPNGAFYDRTEAEICFKTEEEAIESGFRKSSR